MFRKIIKQIISGIGIGCTLLTGILFFATLIGGEAYVQNLMADYIRQSLCAITVAVVFSLLSLIYESEKLSFKMQTCIHMGGGLAFYFIVAVYARWIPTGLGVGVIIGTIISMIIAAFAMWFGYYLYFRNEAKKMTNKIKEMDRP